MAETRKRRVQGCTVIQMDVNSPEWKEKIKKLDEKIQRKEGDQRHANPLVRDTLYDKGITSYW